MSTSAQQQKVTVDDILQWKEVDREWFLVGKKLDTNHVKQVCGPVTLGMSQNDLEAIANRMIKDRREAQSWAKA